MDAAQVAVSARLLAGKGRAGQVEPKAGAKINSVVNCPTLLTDIVSMPSAIQAGEQGF